MEIELLKRQLAIRPYNITQHTKPHVLDNKTYLPFISISPSRSSKSIWSNKWHKSALLKDSYLATSSWWGWGHHPAGELIISTCFKMQESFWQKNRCQKMEGFQIPMDVQREGWSLDYLTRSLEMVQDFSNHQSSVETCHFLRSNSKGPSLCTCMVVGRRVHMHVIGWVYNISYITHIERGYIAVLCIYIFEVLHSSAIQKKKKHCHSKIPNCWNTFPYPNT